MKRLISYDWTTGVSVWHEYDDVTKQTEITHTYDDCAHILESNKYERNNFDRSKQAESWWKVGSIPLSIINKWMLEEGWDPFKKENAGRVWKKLNDPEWAYLRTSPGKV